MSNLDTIKHLINDNVMMKQFKAALPAHITPEKFVRVATTALLTNPDIANCTTESVMKSLLRCAADGLMPDGKEAALVKYGNNAQYTPMVYGVIKRMRNSGDVTRVNAYCVYENDKYSFSIINGVEQLSHEPKLVGDRGNMIFVYAVISLRDGDPHIDTMTKAEIDKTREVSKGKNGPAWTNWYDEMAKKTVIHRAGKRVPTSADIEEFMSRNMTYDILGNTENEAAPAKNLVDSMNEAITVQSSPPQENQIDLEEALEAREIPDDVAKDALTVAPQEEQPISPAQYLSASKGGSI